MQRVSARERHQLKVVKSAAFSGTNPGLFSFPCPFCQYRFSADSYLSGRESPSLIVTLWDTGTSRRMVSTRLMAGSCAEVALSSPPPGRPGPGSSASDQASAVQQQVFLLDLPVELLDKIFAYVGYKKVAQIRVVSRQMNQVCSLVLNSTFSRLQNQIMGHFQTVKAKMPRR